MPTCKWTEESDSEFWATDCGELFTLNNGTPKDNRMIYCCFCGRIIEQHALENDE